MSEDLERRLAAAYRARADLVTEDGLRASAPPELAGAPDSAHGLRSAQLRRAARWGLPLLAAASVALIVTATVGFSHPTARTKPVGPLTPTPTPTVVPTPTVTPTNASPSPRPSVHRSSSQSRPSDHPAGPVALAAGQVGTDAQIPWSLVGDGWTAAIWSPTPDAGSPRTLYLVDPAGGRYEVTALPGDQMFVADVSADHRRVLVEGRLDPQRVYDVDLTSGQVQPLSLPASTEAVEYARPDSDGYVVVVGKTVQLFSSTGEPERTYPYKTVNMFGVLPLISPDGTRFVFDNDTSLLVTDQDGDVVATLPIPNGARSCTAVRWWQPGVVVTRCDVGGSARLWLTPLDGAAPTFLDPLSSPGAGDGDVWTIGGEMFVGTAPSCGSASRIGRLDSSGRTTWLPLPPVGPYGVMVATGATNDAIYGLVNIQCVTPQQRALIRFDPVAGASTLLFGGDLGGGSVNAAITFGVDEQIARGL